MNKIVISTYDAASLAAARRAGENRAYIWRRIRDVYGIPSDFKLGMATDRSLYVKGSEPRTFLYADDSGRYAMSGSARTYETVQPSTVAAASPGRFVVPGADGDSTSWFCVNKQALLNVLNDVCIEDDNESEPPPGVDPDAELVFDTLTGDVYFRA